jgi:hypothetical protein
MVLAEISDKMPSAAGMGAVCAVVAVACLGLAWVDRGVAWVMLVLAVVGGGVLAVDGYREARGGGPFADAIWTELGWPWVMASTAGPLLPAVAVGTMMVVRRRRSVSAVAAATCNGLRRGLP